MLKKKIEWIMGTVTLALVLAVVSVYFLHSDNKEESTAFLPASRATYDQMVDSSDVKAMADIDSIKLDILADRYSDNFNRSLNTMPESLKISIDDLSGISGEFESDSNSELKKDKTEAGTELIVEENMPTINISETVTYVEDVPEQPIMVESPAEVWVEPEVQVDVPAEPEVPAEVPTEPEIPAEVQAAPEVPAETTPTAAPVAPAAQSIQFVSPGSSSAAATNHSLIAGLIKPNGKASYHNFTENGDGTITVDGYTFAYTSTNYSTITGYDGIESRDTGTSSGLRTTRGLAATVFPKYGGYPFGTVLFIEGYGLVVIADYNGMGAVDSSWLDVCYYDNELATGIDPGRTTSRVFVLSTN
ncbi:MAG TPA: hypothetical protein GXZ76_04035 [Clostridiaceae bacterium]|nr:hypothetical protein [Clostridiaceae bacterium]